MRIKIYYCKHLESDKRVKKIYTFKNRASTKKIPYKTKLKMGILFTNLNFYQYYDLRIFVN